VDEERGDLRIYSIDEVRRLVGENVEIIILEPTKTFSGFVDEENLEPISAEMLDPIQKILIGSLSKVQADGICQMDSTAFCVRNIRRIKMLKKSEKR